MSDEDNESVDSAAAKVANLVAMQVGIVGGILGCCQALLILVGGFLVGLMFFWHPKEKTRLVDEKPKQHIAASTPSPHE
jgi:hypothetical protein